MIFFFFSSRRRHTRSLCDWSSDVCSSDLPLRITGNNNPGFVVANAGTTKFTMGIPTANGNFVANSSINDVAFRADGAGKVLFSTSATGATNDLTLSGGNAGIGCSAPGSQLVIASGSGCSTPSSSINAGSTQVTGASSRTFKENIATVDVPDILNKIESIPVVTYDFRNGGPTDRLGLIAEDFHQVFERGSDKYIDGQEVQMALWMAVQKLTAENKALTDRLSKIEGALAQQQKP